MSVLESSLTRLAKPKKADFTRVNDHFLDKHNEVSGLYRQTLIPATKAELIHRRKLARCLRLLVLS